VIDNEILAFRSEAVTDLAEIQKRNNELAVRINQEALANPQSPYAGKFVGIANGQVAAVADNLDDAVTLLLQVEPDTRRTCCIEASLDYSVVEDICSLESQAHLQDLMDLPVFVS
jgi:hypothetical protein